jgi:hypothetical protein
LKFPTNILYTESTIGQYLSYHTLQTAYEPPGKCEVQMKVTRSLIEPVGVTIERAREHLHTNIEESCRVKKPTMLKRVTEQERVKHYSPSQIFHAMHGAGSAEGAQLHAVRNVLAAGREGDEEREDIVTGYMEMVRSAIEPALCHATGRYRQKQIVGVVKIGLFLV